MTLNTNLKAPWQARREGLWKKGENFIFCTINGIFPGFWTKGPTNCVTGPAETSEGVLLLSIDSSRMPLPLLKHPASLEEHAIGIVTNCVCALQQTRRLEPSPLTGWCSEVGCQGGDWDLERPWGWSSPDPSESRGRPRLLSPPRGDTVGRCCLWTRRWALPRRWICWCCDLRLHSLPNCEKWCLWHKSSVYGVLLQQHKWTHTGTYHPPLVQQMATLFQAMSLLQGLTPLFPGGTSVVQQTPSSYLPRIILSNLPDKWVFLLLQNKSPQSTQV